MLLPRLSRWTPFSFHIIPTLSSSHSLQPTRRFSIKSTLRTGDESTSSPVQALPANRKKRWKPMCLYYTQDKCTMMDDPAHNEIFSHDCSSGLELVATHFKNLQSQELDFFLVFDLEGKVEILEFPVLLFHAKTMTVVDFFHRFVRPSKMTEHRINQYIEGKYGKLGVDRYISKFASQN